MIFEHVFLWICEWFSFECMYPLLIRDYSRIWSRNLVETSKSWVKVATRARGTISDQCKIKTSSYLANCMKFPAGLSSQRHFLTNKYSQWQMSNNKKLLFRNQIQSNTSRTSDTLPICSHFIIISHYYINFILTQTHTPKQRHHISLSPKISPFA